MGNNVKRSEQMKQLLAAVSVLGISLGMMRPEVALAQSTGNGSINDKGSGGDSVSGKFSANGGTSMNDKGSSGDSVSGKFAGKGSSTGKGTGKSGSITASDDWNQGGTGGSSTGQGTGKSGSITASDDWNQGGTGGSSTGQGTGKSGSITANDDWTQGKANKASAQNESLAQGDASDQLKLDSFSSGGDRPSIAPGSPNLPSNQDKYSPLDAASKDALGAPNEDKHKDWLTSPDFGSNHYKELPAVQDKTDANFLKLDTANHLKLDQGPANQIKLDQPADVASPKLNSTQWKLNTPNAH
jgi:hypothetical protein